MSVFHIISMHTCIPDPIVFMHVCRHDTTVAASDVTGITGQKMTGLNPYLQVFFGYLEAANGFGEVCNSKLPQM